MSYRLKLSFDPNFNYSKLQPRHKADGGVDHFDLGYVQSVHRNEVLACWEDSDQNVLGSEAYTLELEEKKMPAGPNCHVDPGSPDCLLASVDGYIVYRDDEISVKTLLNVRRDVDFHTGNIRFPGDIVFASDVRSGFSVIGRHIWVKGEVEAANLRATGSVIVDGGVKGGQTGQIRARGGIRVRFCEQCRLRARTGILVKGSSLHCRLYAGRKLVVSERLVGGSASSRDLVYVKEQLGGGLSTETEVIVGYDPALLLRDDMVVEKMRKLRDRRSSLERVIRREGGIAELQKKLSETSARITALKARRAEMWESYTAVGNYGKCRVIVPGAVRPGVDIYIGPAYLKVQDFLENVHFYYKDGEVCVGSPALPGKR
ncbi:MAG: FapA family protein [Desulfovibrio sp.]|uniref:FapA family protein n=1 Tax=Desulfovibrio sp. 7SRBS1 TaxID=3378064 RepID=UPI003B402F91